MSRLTTMLVRESESRRMAPGSVRIMYILKGKAAHGSAILDWVNNFKETHFYGKGLRGLNQILVLHKPWEAIHEQIRLDNQMYSRTKRNL